MKRSRYRDTDVLRSEYAARGEAIRARLRDFAAVPGEEYFYELAYCLLTPQSSARDAGFAIDALQRAGFRERGVDPLPMLHQPGYYIRFHVTKARRLLKLRDEWSGIAAILARTEGAEKGRELRTWLVGHVDGLGWKEASHFLRNVGYRDLAILDRHILRNLRRHGVLRTLPRAMSRDRYLAIEQAFHRFAQEMKIPLDELDLLFWSRETGQILK